MALDLLPVLPAAADLLRHWPDAAEAGAASPRLARFCLAVFGQDVAADGPGRRNQRLLLLHRALTGRLPEAQMICPHCAAANEVALPVDALLALPAPAAGSLVGLTAAAGPMRAGLPAAGDPLAADPLRLARSLIAGADARAFTAADLPALAAAWEEADPAGSLTLGLDCAGCGQGFAALADPAAFVAPVLDALIDRLFREIDLIARAYGWSEGEILALPENRRRRYVGMILATGSAGTGTTGAVPARRLAAGGRA
ncbi:hypothetical protein [Pseudogemmobacter bohemicus]|uniref:hypothetical protein n=1 Tax=Pseudogemmobacter bohemicus TaxID=2250708 RepID=UPI000DD3386E|nr:hypothetical protein [Pseudogemmobacter bohemicus]